MLILRLRKRYTGRLWLWLGLWLRLRCLLGSLGHLWWWCHTNRLCLMCILIM
ncbi:uncharacterized protein DS421_20g697650 [Arachis hypogaea]|nr:uncharacterized protein DS421_20g697650 [Arachis hypogaea]